MTSKEIQQIRERHVPVWKTYHPMLPDVGGKQYKECSHCGDHFPCDARKLLDQLVASEEAVA